MLYLYPLRLFLTAFLSHFLYRLLFQTLLYKQYIIVQNNILYDHTHGLLEPGDALRPSPAKACKTLFYTINAMFYKVKFEMRSEIKSEMGENAEGRRLR